MKTYKVIILSVTCVLGVLVSTSAQPSPNPAKDQTPVKAGTASDAELKPAPPAKKPGQLSTGATAPTADQAAAAKGGAVSGDKPASGAKADEATKLPPAPAHVMAEGEKGIRMNFRGASLEQVLNYLSDAAGFAIILDPGARDISGKVDVWSNQPLSKDEALQVLNQVLAKQGYAVLRKENSLTVVRREMAMKMDVPVVTGNDPTNIPKGDEIRTQIIPVRFINAPQVAKDLLPLLPEGAELVANQDGNALVMTDTQTNIRRLAEIVKALDTAVSSLSSVKVFALKFADAKALATVVKDLFTTQDSGGGSRGGMDPRSRIIQMMSGGRGGPGGPGGGMPGMPGSSSGGRPGATKVAATADERSNSLIVSAPADVMPAIVELVESVDTDVEELTELRVFALQHADPQETADLLTKLFPDPTASGRSGSSGSSRFGRFAGGGGPGGSRGSGGSRGPGGGGSGGSSGSSDRVAKESKVLAVPDYRTGSVVVSASHLMMAQVAQMIEQLDADPKGEQKVFVYELKNGDVQNTEEIVRNLFQGANSRNASSSQRSALETRELQSSQTMGSSGSTGFGGSRSSSGRTSGSTFR